MAKLSEIKKGTVIIGIGSSPVTVIDSEPFANALTITYKDNAGNVNSTLYYDYQIANFKIATDQPKWSFQADGEEMRLVSEAYRIHLAHLFDPYLAVHTSNVEPLPHQISAVYGEMLPRMPLRFVLADDPGAGKTIMTGLYIKELIARGDLQKCLIVCPGNLAEQWQDELYSKFGLRFEIFTNDRIESAVTGNAFEEVPWGIARMDKLARSEEIQQKLKAVDYDLIVVDEAHKMSATVSIFDKDIKYTKRYRLGQLLGSIARNYLLLTATPHNGKPGDFQLFMSLIDPDRFEGQARNAKQKIDVSDCMRRLVKEDLLKFDGKRLFPPRRAFTVNYSLSPAERELYDEVTDYVQHEFNRADQLEKGRKNTVGFALTVLQRRLASSPEAIYQSLRRRRKRLEDLLRDKKEHKETIQKFNLTEEDLDDFDDDYGINEGEEEEIVDQVTASRTIEEMEAEIHTLKNLEDTANSVRLSGHDRKWEELSRLLQETSEMYDKDGNRQKIIIFTEHKDTLSYLERKIKSLLGRDEAVVSIYGGMDREERKRIEAQFKQEKDVLVMLATDAASEGINMQRAHLMINYDLPWNPNRLEQRFGRIHRIGQTEVCYLWNLVAIDTREGKVFDRLFKKLEEENNALDGKVFDVLGKLTFNNQPLRDLLIEAIRKDDTPEVRNYLNEVIDNSLERGKLVDLINEHGLVHDVLSKSQVLEIREDMERAEAHKMQPHFIESFFLEAFKVLGGQIRNRENHRYEILKVPHHVQESQQLDGYPEPILPRYQRVCFDKKYCSVEGKPLADLICPGHPLMEAVIACIMEKYGNLLQEGTIYINENDPGEEPRFLAYIENAIQDGTVLSNGKKQVISEQFNYVLLDKNGTAQNGGYAPYLDYRGATGEELAKIVPYLKTQPWINNNLDHQAMQYAVVNMIPKHLQSVKTQKLNQIHKTEKEVKKRLDYEINYWDARAFALKQDEAAGKVNAKINSAKAKQRADDLEVRKERRLQQLEAEKQISSLPPVIRGGALVIPQGLLNKLMPGAVTVTPDPYGSGDRLAMEQEGIDVIFAVERSLGNKPRDCRKENCGYDVESEVAHPENEERSLRLIELKTRQAGATEIVVTTNEIKMALTNPKGWYLAIVELDGNKKHVTYIENPFREEDRLSWSQTKVSVNIERIKKQGTVAIDRDM